MEYENDSLLDLIEKTAEFDREAAGSVEKEEQQLTFKRDEDGILWCYDVKTGEKVGRIFEHGDDASKEE